MSEAADTAEQEVEDFFNEEIFGAPKPVANDPAFPGEAPPEPKPVEEIATDEPVEEETPEEVEGEAPPEGEEDEAAAVVEGEEQEQEAEAPTEDEYVAWAKKQYGDDLDLENEQVNKLAKAAWEKEKLLGKKAEEARTLHQQAQEREIQARIDALNTPGVLTPEEDTWVNESLVSGDPGEWAYNALQQQRPDLYAAIMDRWSSMGEQESRMARVFHSRIVQAVSTPQPSEQETYTAALGATFTALGLDIEQHGPLVLAKAEELGSAHPAVQGMMSHDEDVRKIATRAVFDLVTQGATTIQKAKTDDVVAQRVQEEKLRDAAAGIQTGGPRVEQPKKSKFWEEFETEAEERGWNGNRPQYGKE